jgi:hypothetical protein
MITSPAVGSTSLERHRTTVDFPEPDRPMMTKISPRWTSKLTSQAAGIQPPSRNAAATASTFQPDGLLGRL